MEANQPPVDFPKLQKNEVHVWRISLVSEQYDLAVLQRYLSTSELKKAERFHFHDDQKGYIIGRSILRLLLSQYLQILPAELELRQGEYGKPFLAPGCNEAVFDFNLSHSEGVMLCVISRHRQVGIDIEYITADIDELELADRFFTPQEAALLKTLPAADRLEAFYTLWTVKEAYLKAIGMGVANGLESFDVPYSVMESLVLERNEKRAGRWRQWHLRILHTAPGYIAAIAAEGPQWKLKYRDWGEFLPGQYKR